MTTYADIRAELADLVAFGVAPILTLGQLDRALARSRLVDRYGVEPDQHVIWTASTAYAAGAIVIPDPRNDHYYTAQDPGTSGATAPAWPTGSGATVLDNDLTWRESGAAPWVATYDMARAESICWRKKAAIASQNIGHSTAVGRYNHSEVYDHCMKMAAAAARRILSNVRSGYAEELEYLEL